MRTCRVLTALVVLVGASIACTAIPAASAGAAGLPLVFQIRADDTGSCAALDGSMPFYVRSAPCSVTSLSQRWVYVGVSNQISSAQLTATGRCLSLDVAPNSLNRLRMDVCDSSLPQQRWSSGAAASEPGCSTLESAYAPRGLAYLAVSYEDRTPWRAYPNGAFANHCFTFPLVS